MTKVKQTALEFPSHATYSSEPSAVARTPGAAGCGGRPWRHRDCAASRWRGSVGRRAGDERTASLMSYSPKHKLKHIYSDPLQNTQIMYTSKCRLIYLWKHFNQLAYLTTVFKRTECLCLTFECEMAGCVLWRGLL